MATTGEDRSGNHQVSTDSAANSWPTPSQAEIALREGDGAGVKVAIIDSGVDCKHPDLNGLELEDSVSVIAERGRIAVREGEGFDIYGHGTAVAGLVRKVAPAATIGSFRVLDARNSSRSDIIRSGVQLALDRGYQILNCSFGCVGSVRYIEKYKDWVDHSYLHGVHVIAACSNNSMLEPEWPAYFTSVVSVNMARTDSDFVIHRPGQMVSFAARGEKVEVPWLDGKRRVETGSSLATPTVSGYMARLISAFPDLSPAMAKELLGRCAEPWQDEMRCGIEY